MFLLPTLHRLFTVFSDSQSHRELSFLSAAADTGDFERRLAQLEACTRQRASGIVAGLYPR